MYVIYRDVSSKINIVLCQVKSNDIGQELTATDWEAVCALDNKTRDEDKTKTKTINNASLGLLLLMLFSPQ